MNTRVELAEAAAVLRDRINERTCWPASTIVDPASTWIEPGVELAPDSVVHPFTVLRGRTTVAADAEIGPHVVAVDAVVGPGVIGRALLLPSPRHGRSKPERRRARSWRSRTRAIGAGTKVPHLSYIGDADIGEDTNIGAGAITANFPHQPGRPKGRTTIGSNVRTGVHNTFEAPVDDRRRRVDRRRARYITDDVPPDSLAASPARGRSRRRATLRGKRND